MNNKVLIKNARAIVTCDSLDQVFYDCDMLIDGPEIKEIGKNLEAEGAKVINAKGKFVYPGLINTHHHFFQTFVRNMMSIDYPNMLVVDWLDKIYPIFEKPELLFKRLINMFPLDGIIKPAIIFSSVDFPHPEGPTILKKLPSFTLNETSFKAEVSAVKE